jgi:hypothetical protein
MESLTPPSTPRQSALHPTKRKKKVEEVEEEFGWDSDDSLEEVILAEWKDSRPTSPPTPAQKVRRRAEQNSI